MSAECAKKCTQVEIEIPVYVQSVQVGEPRGMFSVVGIKAWDSRTSRWQTLYAGEADAEQWEYYVQTKQYNHFAPSICETTFTSSIIRVELNTFAMADFNELDYLKVTGATSAKSGVFAPTDLAEVVVHYSPDADFNGEDSIMIAGCDCAYNSGRTSDETRVTISILAVNDAPVAQTDSIVLGCMPNIPDTITLQSYDIDTNSTSLTYSIDTLPGGADLYDATTGGRLTSSMLPAHLSGAGVQLLANFGGDEPPSGFNFEFTVTDNLGAVSVSAPVSVTCQATICDPGMFFDMGQLECTSCPVGAAALEAGIRTTCDLCAVGTFAPNIGMASCGSCESGRVALDMGLASCVICPAGASCPGGTTIVVAAGHWRTSSLSRTIMACPYGTCKGEDGNVTICAEGSRGRLCGVCEPEYFLDKSRCRECRMSHPLLYAAVLLLALGMLFVIAIAAWIRFSNPQARSKRRGVASVALIVLRSMDVQRCKIAWVTASIIGSMSWTTNVVWPPPLSYFTAGLAALSEFSFIPVSCINPNVTFYEIMVASSSVPCAFVMVIWACSLVAPTKISHKKFIQIALLVAFIVLPFTTTRIFQTFICTEFSDGVSMLNIDLSLECDGPLYDGMFAFAVMQCLIFPIGVPLMFTTLLWANRQSIMSRDPSEPCPDELQHIAILFKYYSNDAYYWEVVECIRRLLLSSVIILTGQTNGARSTWGTFVAIMSSVAMSEWRPCQDHLTQAFGFASYWLVTVYFLLSAVLAAGFGVFSPSTIGTLLVVATILTTTGGVVHWRNIESMSSAAINSMPRDVSNLHVVKAHPCIIICDPGRGVGSELCLVLLRVMRDIGHLSPKGVIANLYPQQNRARLLRGTLDALGMHDVPVAAGTNGGSTENDNRCFENAQKYVPEEGTIRAGDIMTGPSLLQTEFERAEPKSMTLILLSSLKVGAAHQHADVVN